MLSDIGFNSVNLDYYPDDFAALKGKLEDDVLHNVALIVFIGGTGIYYRDITTEAVQSIIKKEIQGFGEEFRRRSYKQIGGKGLLSRAIAGITNKSVIVALPGSLNAAVTGIELLSEMIAHTLQLLRKEK